ncbi:hypothetical protein Cfor_06511 [Coptotermes formosanus]|uniref:ferroxidase n=1 Tax=Coptotermes formosanus TaxID=36987 RepID=A0A6L2Q6J9_COPFO|nr:hypothetical protein Cfor_06511 [Coptotermes formosanus]
MLSRFCNRLSLRVTVVRLDTCLTYDKGRRGFKSLVEHKRCILTYARENNERYKQKRFCGYSGTIGGPLTHVTYEQVCNETLESLSEYFEEIVEEAAHLKAADVSYSDGVLTVKFGVPHGTYVINRQTPNLQIWLSSPISGPKRYDFHDGRWIYRHDGVSLHELLSQEIPDIVNRHVDFFHCAYSGSSK